MIPPQERPNVPLLRQLGFSGSDEQVVARVAQQEPDLLSAVSSASAARWASPPRNSTPAAPWACRSCAAISMSSMEMDRSGDRSYSPSHRKAVAGGVLLFCTFVLSHGLFFHRKQFRSMLQKYFSYLWMVASKFSLFSTKTKSYFQGMNHQKRRFFS